jgi:hypothetical protein
MRHVPIGKSVGFYMVVLDFSGDSEPQCELDRIGEYNLFCSPETEEMLNHTTVGATNEHRVADSMPEVLEAQYLLDAHQVRKLNDFQELREN